jgi:ABC-type transport system involved in cytochrome c biogenesis ATPase subunit
VSGLAITASELTKRYGRATVVDQLSFTARPGAITGFLGPNGAGKSTTLRMLLGLTTPSSGTITVGGRRLVELDSPARTVGALLDARSVHPQRGAHDHLLAYAMAGGVPRMRVGEVLEIVGPTDAGGGRVGEYSLGMQQRLGIATALLGYAIFGRWTKQEMLLDPDDVAAGNVTRFRRSNPDRIVRSRRPAHPAIATVPEFTDVQLRRRSRAAGGLAASRRLERGPKETKRAYPMRGRVRRGYRERRMEGTPRGERTYYRCAARSPVPGSPALADHPKNVYLPEATVPEQVNHWLGDLFTPENIDKTIAALVASQNDPIGRPAITAVTSDTDWPVSNASW